MSSHPQSYFEFLLFDGFSNMVLANAMEPLRDVKLRSVGTGPDWVVSTLNGAPVKSSSGLQIAPDCVFDPARKGRRLVLVTGYHMRKWATPAVLAKLRKAARRAEMILALDTASWLLAEAGLLDGQVATIHWQEVDEFSEVFPKVRVSTARFVRSGLFLTCGGASTVLDLMLELIRDLYGPAAAFEASTMFVYDPERQNELHRGAKRLRDKGSPVLLSALDEIARNVEAPLSTFELAKRVSASERTLNRLFARELGITPGKYYRMFRLQHARYLAQETKMSIEQIALRCGFSSASSLSRSFSMIMGYPIRRAPNLSVSGKIS
ncbi:GlxA family transcriptional regulator [Pelagibius sp. Alg239-R121]|uniref:GlxA family transcriptional regulator n=1 Tax=Pelagibius sp. Alg239-R121 TaxID=2993448 RepID=UPI0024A6D876|nr:helix-turn-helix domain-containing protein [Pelagibius sp. Alg239-R121]